MAFAIMVCFSQKNEKTFNRQFQSFWGHYIKFLKFEVDFSIVLLYIELICIYLYYHLSDLAHRCFNLLFLKFAAHVC